jgi:hypothetical protein
MNKMNIFTSFKALILLLIALEQHCQLFDEDPASCLPSKERNELQFTQICFKAGRQKRMPVENRISLPELLTQQME